MTPVELEPSPSRTDVFGRSWEGRRVAIVGLGRSGMAAMDLLCRMGCRVRITEAKETPELRTMRDTCAARGVEDVEIGGHSQRLIEQSELLVVSPGVPETAGPIRWALARRLPILSEIELAFRFCPSTIIAVTGTNGKSTTVTLIAELLKASGHAAIACGNLGIPFSSILQQLTSRTIAVVEVSSFQLLWCDQFRPHVGVLLNVGANHLDRHPDAEAYLSAKARLFQRQTPTDWAILNGSDPRIVGIGEQCHAQRVWFGEDRSNPPWLRLAGQTRQSFTESAQAVLQVGRLLGIPDPLSWQVIRTCRGLEHRMEPVATTPRGVRFVNDSKSTTPDSLRFALSETPGDVVVIIGGRDKGLDFGDLLEPLHRERVKGIVLIGESRSRLHSVLNGHASRSVVRECETLGEAVRVADHLARPGTTVLLSPACASFDMFRDFEDRGRAFKAIVNTLTGGTRNDG
ncbi:MAG: UDP-N-acetylmuramoyl-L-alanine--D-glutamate ligase [Candidatus Omnitrophica bacterium]|nr:UDP-N-acetylmuramoyl-L-alanine--D-glutamate ligase [Candidatus Omnitrophota bacterium]